jgi:hypothetical protein
MGFRPLPESSGRTLGWRVEGRLTDAEVIAIHEQLDAVARMAVVGDASWQQWLAAASAALTPVELRRFPPSRMRRLGRGCEGDGRGVGRATERQQRCRRHELGHGYVVTVAERRVVLHHGSFVDDPFDGHG